MPTPTLTPSFLPATLPPALPQKWKALLLNTRAWHQRLALAKDPSSEIWRSPSPSPFPSPPPSASPSNDLTLCTPTALTIPSPTSLSQDSVLDAVLAWYRARPYARRTAGDGSGGGVVFWYMHPGAPGAELSARLFARGVAANWRPGWMWCALASLEAVVVAARSSSWAAGGAVDSVGKGEGCGVAADADVDADAGSGDAEVGAGAGGFEIRVVGEGGEGDDGGYSSDDAVMNALYRMRPRCVWHLSASRRGVAGRTGIGGCTLNVTTGPEGVGGLYDLWVDPQVRRQGLGIALVRAACLLARRLGCWHVVVNSTEMGESVYQRAGFESLGRGYTWYLDGKTLKRPPPSRDVVRFLEGVGTGAVEILDEVGGRLTVAQLQEPSLNKMTPFEIAVRCKKPASAAWLLEHGVIPDVMSLWELGWKDRVASLLVEHPELARRKAGRWTATPLHYAIENDDMELAKLLLTVPNDLEIRDAVFDSTPLGWARHFQRLEILEMLEGQTTLLESGDIGR